MTAPDDARDEDVRDAVAAHARLLASVAEPYRGRGLPDAAITRAVEAGMVAALGQHRRSGSHLDLASFAVPRVREQLLRALRASPTRPV